MLQENSLNDVFRFTQLRPPAPAKEVATIPLLETGLAESLKAASTPEARAELASAALTDETAVLQVSDVSLGERIVAALGPLRSEPNATTKDLSKKLGNTGPPKDLEKDWRRLSDTLLASFFATRSFPQDLKALQDVYRVYDLLRREAQSPAAAEPLDRFLARPIVVPFVVPPLPSPAPPPAEIVSEASPAPDAPRPLAVRNAPTLARQEDAELPASHRPHIRPAGVAELLVVKQQIKRYEAAEIAHVENVLAGEKKARTHRQLERSEETFLTETETTREKKNELEAVERFELNRETSRTIKEDEQFGFGLSVSGKYGPSVEFSSNFEMDIKRSREETAKSASSYARNVTERSLERLSERVFEQRIRKIIRETEETNLHELNNQTGDHVRGIYQFIDKVYEAQVFNYGIREMFDFMVPEPASFLWYLEQRSDSGLSLPQPPPRLDQFLADASAVKEDKYQHFAALWGATDVVAPPPLYRLLNGGLRHGDDETASEEKMPRSTGLIEFKIPLGYRPWKAEVQCLALTDEDPVIGVTVGAQKEIWGPSIEKNELLDLGENHRMAHRLNSFSFDLSKGDSHELTEDNKLRLSILAWETNTYAVDASLVCRRSDEALEAWRLSTYAKIRSAYESRVQEHEQLVGRLRAEAEAKAERDSQLPFGAPPSENRRTILTELKKHCVSIITRQRYDAFDATKSGTNGGTDDSAKSEPFFDFDEAEKEGSFIRFFEQAFEWDQMQWVFYPYFWARKTTWPARFLRDDIDPQFREFLQAGSARVVVPVRPGFEPAVTHFLETGKLWNGTGEPPRINTPLYVSIVDEIRERTGAPKADVKAVGEPWEVRVPTPLLLLRGGADLPRWERAAADKWEWRPVEPTPGVGRTK